MSILTQFALIGFFFFSCSQLFAQPWKFSKQIDVSSPAKKGVFHHLESSGRRNIAVSGNILAIVWEDDSDDGTPRIYLARKTLESNKFDSKIRISADSEAFEPSITPLDNGRFAIAWEENKQISIRIVAPQKKGPILKLGKIYSTQPSLAYKDNLIMLVHKEQTQKFGQIMLQKLIIKERLHLALLKSCAVDTSPLKNDQLYPVIALLNNGVNVAWEDRRLGHTIIMHSESKPNNACNFSSPVRISEQPPGPKTKFGAGHGVARVSLANYGTSNLYAVWADKRNFQEGYDIYGANKKNDNAFGANVRVQDDFGSNNRQWHASAAGHPNGQLITAWTDERDGTMDIWYSWLEDGQWSDDNIFPQASGKGIQYHPTITLDHLGNLHVAWIHRETDGAPTQIKYLYAPRKMNNNE